MVETIANTVANDPTLSAAEELMAPTITMARTTPTPTAKVPIHNGVNSSRRAGLLTFLP
jgi:hypothetical protein